MTSDSNDTELQKCDSEATIPVPEIWHDKNMKVEVDTDRVIKGKGVLNTHKFLLVDVLLQNWEETLG